MSADLEWPNVASSVPVRVLATDPIMIARMLERLARDLRAGRRAVRVGLGRVIRRDPDGTAERYTIALSSRPAVRRSRRASARRRR